MNKDVQIVSTGTNLIRLVVDNKPVAKLKLWDIHTETIYLSSLYTNKKERNKGYAKILLKYAIDYFITNEKAESVRLYVEANNEIAINLYTKFGFFKVFPTKIDKKKHYLMVKKISE